MAISKFFKIIGLTCISLAIVLLWQRNNSSRVAFKSTPIEKKIEEKLDLKKPTRLEIVKQNIDLPIVSARVYGQNWETSTSGVSWLDISPIPGEIGNSIIYGHNWTNLLGRLLFVKPGDEIIITYEDQSQKKFKVENTAMVSPNDVSVLAQSSKRAITIYTCAGFFDEKRYVVFATLLQETSRF